MSLLTDTVNADELTDDGSGSVSLLSTLDGGGSPIPVGDALDLQSNSLNGWGHLRGTSAFSNHVIHTGTADGTGVVTIHDDQNDTYLLQATEGGPVQSFQNLRVEGGYSLITRANDNAADQQTRVFIDGFDSGDGERAFSGIITKGLSSGGVGPNSGSVMWDGGGGGGNPTPSLRFKAGGQIVDEADLGTEELRIADGGPIDATNALLYAGAAGSFSGQSNAGIGVGAAGNGFSGKIVLENGNGDDAYIQSNTGELEATDLNGNTTQLT